MLNDVRLLVIYCSITLPTVELSSSAIVSKVLNGICYLPV